MADQKDPNGSVPVLGTVPPVDTTNTPVTGQLQEPAAAPQQQMDLQSPATSVAAAPPAAPGAPQPQGHGVLGDIFETLAGGKKKVWQQTDQGPVATYQDLKPGEMARGILAAALTGLAGGYDPARRGKGPAMSAAFSGGFKANEERRETQDTQAAQEAQKQFQNAGVSQERQLAAHRDALAQQESIRAAQKHDIDMQVAKENLTRGKELDAEHIADRDALDSQKLIDAKNSGAAPVMGTDGKILEFKSDHDLMQYVQQSDANAARVFGSNSMLNTERLRDPATGMIYVYQRPIDDHAPRWMGVLLDKDKKPILDKNGEMQIDKKNPWFGPDGKARVPASKMTPAEFTADLRASLNLRSEGLRNQLTSLQIQNQQEEYKMRMKNDNAQQLAEQHMTEAGDDFNAINPKTNKPYLSDEDKNYYMSTTLHQAQGAQTLLASLDKDINTKEAADPKDPELPGLRQQADAARLQLQQYQSQVQMLSKSGTQAIIDYQRKVHPEDMDAVKKDIATLPEGQQRAVIEGLKKPVEPTDPLVKNMIGALANSSNDQVIASVSKRVQSGAITPEQANLVYKYRGITPPAATTPAATATGSAPGAAGVLDNLSNKIVEGISNVRQEAKSTPGITAP